MYLSETIRNAIWENQSNGTIIFHPKKTAGTAIKSLFRQELGFGYVDLSTLQVWSDTSSFNKKFHVLETEFSEVVSMGRKWCIGFGHDSLSTKILRDIPEGCTLLMPYRPIRDRGKSMLKYIYSKAKFFESAELNVTSESSSAINLKTRHPRWDPSNTFQFQEDSNPKRFIHKNLDRELIMQYASFIPQAKEVSQRLESGDLCSIFENSTQENFTFTDILQDLLTKDLESQKQLNRINFLDQGMIDSFFLRKFRKPPPKLNVSRDENFSREFLNHLEGEKFLKLIADLEVREFNTEKLIKSRLRFNTIDA